MGTRHHVSGRYASKGRQPRTEPKHGEKPAKPSQANAAFNNHMKRANAPGAVATAGQVVATIKVN